MPAVKTKLFLVIGILILAGLACHGYNLWFDGEKYEQNKYEDWADALMDAHRGAYPTPTPRATRTKGPGSDTQIVIEATAEIKPGYCAWTILPESDAYPYGSQGENFHYGMLNNGYGLETLLIHSNPAQQFRTWHVFELSQTFIPGDLVSLSASFTWTNDGDSANAALVKAGGVSILTVGDIKLTARHDDINVRTQPEGSLSDTADWVVPQGVLGDRLTLTQHVSTGSYGVNIRWYYLYTCGEGGN